MRIFKPKKCLVFGLSLTIVTSGCGGGGFDGNPGNPGNPSSGTIYVSVDSLIATPPDIYLFSTTADGNVVPPNITGPATIDEFAGLAVDSAGNVYVGGDTLSGDPSLANEILVYAPGARGRATPRRTINGPSTGLSSINQSFSITALAVDRSGNLYVASIVSAGGGGIFGISVFPSTSNGDAAPARVIAGSATNINDAFGGMQLAVDASGNIYTTGQSLSPASIIQSQSIVVFGPSANGNVAPANTIAGSNTMITNAEGVALDSAGNIYVANGSVTAFPSGEVTPPAILEFSAGSTGNMVPIRIISGSATTLIDGFGNLSLDNAGNIYVLNNTNVLKFGSTASGNVAPIATIGAPPDVFILGATSMAVD